MQIVRPNKHFSHTIRVRVRVWVRVIRDIRDFRDIRVRVRVTIRVRVRLRL